ncbi:protein of unknown function [Stenotrophomonas maltophilia]|nr:protein of unknown function [Stenotrophomonas maltophilia]
MAGCVPIPADATGNRIRSIPARLPLPSGSTPRSLYPLDQYCSRPTPPRAATIDGAPCRTGRHCAGRLRQVH